MIGSLISTLANAQKLSIQQIQQGVQSGTIPSYVGIPLIEQKTKQMQEAAMMLAGQQAQGNVPIKDRVMRDADAVTRPEAPPTPTLPATNQVRPAPSQGIDSARSNLPAQYAGGGIVAFADEGLVEDPYYEGNLVPGEEGTWRNKIAELGSWWDANKPHTIYSKKDIARMKEQNEEMDKLFKTRESSPIPSGTTNPLTRPITPLPAGPAAPQTPLSAPPQAQPPAPAPLTIQRGIAPPVTPTPAAAPSAFSGMEDAYKSMLERDRADRDEMRSLIFGQKAERAAEEKQNLSNALMKAGFGMMSGRSPFAGVNVGEGAMAGAEAYGKGLEQLRAGDRQVVSQLVNLGLKGQELDQAAAKLGIDMAQHKAMEPYYASAAAENVAKTGLYPAQAGLYQAEGIRQLAAANKDVVETSLLPGEQNIKQLVAAGKAAGVGKGTPGAGQYMTKLQDWRRTAYMDPESSGVPFDAETAKGLTYPKDSGTYQRAYESAKRAIDAAYAQNVREFQYVGGSAGGSSSE